MRRRTINPLPPHFVRIDDVCLRRLLAQAKQRGIAFGSAVAQMAERGLDAMEEEGRRTNLMEMDWFIHLVETAPQDLEPWQQAVLELSLAEPGLWTMRLPQPIAPAVAHVLPPRIDEQALRKKWPTLVARAHARAALGVP